MLIVGERINSTREKIREAIGKRDAAFIVKEASSQLAAGATFIDINCAVTSADEIRDILKQFPGVTVTGWEQVGNYALRFDFSDGHRTGLYSYAYLLDLARH